MNIGILRILKVLSQKQNRNEIDDRNLYQEEASHLNSNFARELQREEQKHELSKDFSNLGI